MKMQGENHKAGSYKVKKKVLQGQEDEHFSKRRGQNQII